MTAKNFDVIITNGETVNREKWVLLGYMDQKGGTGFLKNNPFNVVYKKKAMNDKMRKIRKKTV